MHTDLYRLDVSHLINWQTHRQTDNISSIYYPGEVESTAYPSLTAPLSHSLPTLAFSWIVAHRAKEVLRDLKSVHKSTDAAESYAMGFGLGFRVMGVKAGENK
jgi:hypothetical protein